MAKTSSTHELANFHRLPAKLLDVDNRKGVLLAARAFPGVRFSSIVRPGRTIGPPGLLPPRAAAVFSLDKIEPMDGDSLFERHLNSNTLHLAILLPKKKPPLLR